MAKRVKAKDRRAAEIAARRAADHRCDLEEWSAFKLDSKKSYNEVERRRNRKASAIEVNQWGELCWTAQTTVETLEPQASLQWMMQRRAQS